VDAELGVQVTARACCQPAGPGSGDQGGVRGALPGVTLDRHAMNVMLMVLA
jgi:hypothetical protein